MFRRGLGLSLQCWGIVPTMLGNCPGGARYHFQPTVYEDSCRRMRRSDVYYSGQNYFPKGLAFLP